MKGRAERRHNDEVKFRRAVKVLLEHGHSNPTRVQRSARKFAASRFGCNCGMCRNPRRMFKGKNKDSLTLGEWRQAHFESLDGEA